MQNWFYQSLSHRDTTKVANTVRNLSRKKMATSYINTTRFRCREKHHIIVNQVSTLGEEAGNWECNIFCGSLGWWISMYSVPEFENYNKNVLLWVLMIMKLFTKDKRQIISYWAVQFSVHMDGLYGLFGPEKVSPQCLPLHALICQMKSHEVKLSWKSICGYATTTVS